MGWVKRIIGETSENRIIGQKKSIIHQGLMKRPSDTVVVSEIINDNG